MTRFAKQLIFGIGFLAVLSLGFLGLAVYKSSKAEPTCSDGIKNQGEEGIDCGFICGNTCAEKLSPLDVLSANFLKVSEGKEKDYDVLFRIYNPNARFGSPKLEYDINFFDVHNTLFMKKSGESYILPGQTRYIYEPLTKTNTEIGRIEVHVTKVDWERLQGGLSKDVNFVLRSKDYQTSTEPGVSFRGTGIVFNDSDFDFDKVDVVAVLLNNETILGASRTDLRTLLSRTERAFTIDWYQHFPSLPNKVVFEVNTNVFESSNLVRHYGTQEKFQRLY